MHEATEGSIKLPLRLVSEGFDINTVDDVLCRLQITKEGFILSEWNGDYKCTLSTDSSEVISYYSYKTTTKDNLQLRVTHRGTEKQYFIEIRVEL